MYLGDFAAGSTIDFRFTSRSSGAPTALSSGDLIVWKSNSTSGSTAGLTLTSTFGAVVGLNHCRILTTGSTSFYADGAEFDVTLSTGSVGGVSVLGETLAHFSITHRSHKPSTDYPTNFGALVVSTSGIADANVQQWRSAAPSTYTTWLASTEKPTNFGELVVSTSGIVDANVQQWRSTQPSTYRDWLDSTDAPTNFVQMIVSTSGIVDANVQQWRGGIPATTAGPPGSTDYSTARAAKLDNLTTSLPTNLSALVISTSGIADVNVQQWRGAAPATMAGGSMLKSDISLSTGTPANFTALAIAAAGGVNLATTAVADVKNQVVAALSSDLYAEPSSAPASSNASLKDRIVWQSALTLQTLTQDSTSQKLINSSSGAVAVASAVLAGGTSGVQRTAWV